MADKKTSNVTFLVMPSDPPVAPVSFFPSARVQDAIVLRTHGKPFDFILSHLFQAPFFESSVFCYAALLQYLSPDFPLKVLTLLLFVAELAPLHSACDWYDGFSLFPHVRVLLFALCSLQMFSFA